MLHVTLLVFDFELVGVREMVWVSELDVEGDAVIVAVSVELMESDKLGDEVDVSDVDCVLLDDSAALIVADAVKVVAEVAEGVSCDLVDDGEDVKLLLVEIVPVRVRETLGEGE